jgi:hypothetical protein
MQNEKRQEQCGCLIQSNVPDGIFDGIGKSSLAVNVSGKRV